MDICVLYESKDNHLLMKMVENVLKHEPRFINGLQLIIPITMKNSKELENGLETTILRSEQTDRWNLKGFQDILSFTLDGVVSMYKFLKVYPPLSEYFHRAFNYELTYDHSQS